jgi:hypothetical protein
MLKKQKSGNNADKGWGIMPTLFYAGGGITMRQFAKSFMIKHLLKAYPHPNPSGSGRVDVIPYPLPPFSALFKLM